MTHEKIKAEIQKAQTRLFLNLIILIMIFVIFCVAIVNFIHDSDSSRIAISFGVWFILNIIILLGMIGPSNKIKELKKLDLYAKKLKIKKEIDNRYK